MNASNGNGLLELSKSLFFLITILTIVFIFCLLVATLGWSLWLFLGLTASSSLIGRALLLGATSFILGLHFLVLLLVLLLLFLGKIIHLPAFPDVVPGSPMDLEVRTIRIVFGNLLLALIFCLGFPADWLHCKHFLGLAFAVPALAGTFGGANFLFVSAIIGVQPRNVPSLFRSCTLVYELK